MRVCLRSIGISFRAYPNRYDLEDLEQRVKMETLSCCLPFIINGTAPDLIRESFLEKMLLDK